MGDLRTLRLLAAGERAVVELYEAASRSHHLTTPVALWIAGALANERDHEETLRRVAAPARLAPAAAGGSSRASVARVLGRALAVETALLGAYLGAVQSLRSPELRVTAAAIAANEAQHVAAIRHLLSGGPTPTTALPAPLAPDRAIRALHVALRSA